MTNHDNGEASLPESNNAIVQTNTGANAPTGSLMQVPMPTAGLGQNPVQDVLKGGINGSWFYHSLRRRWILALSMSTLLSALVAAILYAVLPETFTAEAQYKIASTPLTLIDSESANQTANYEIFQNTQVAQILSPYTLQNALRDRTVSELAMFDGVDDEVDWLQDNLTVRFPNDGEILTISMSGAYPEEDLKRVVEAVSRSYYDGAVSQEKAQRRKPLEVLQGTLGSFEQLIRSKMEAYQELASDAGTSDAYQGGFDPETKFLLSEVEELQKRKAILLSNLSSATMRFRIFEQQINDPAYQDQLVDDALQQDPNIAQMQSEVMGLEMQIRTLQTTVRGGTSAAIRRLESNRDQLSQQIAQMREQLRAQIAGQRSNEPNPLLKAESTSYQITSGMINRELQEAEARLTEIKEELLLKVTKNTDLMLRLSEIEQLRGIEQAIAKRIQNIKIELDAPDRIVAIGAQRTNSAALAETKHSRNQFARIALSGLGGLGVFGLTCFGIGFMEFLNRRLNGADQLDEGLGIRVIGTLPSLSGRKALNPKHPIVAQLSESIDTVRTALMHESTSKRRQVVLVTSPGTSDGRTTVASQLAASLARAGRRTLLVDADLRHSALHTLFNTPLEDGMCELLRAEAEVTDVIRPTEAEGLWIMTAGYCDSEATQALATDQVEPIFEKLRADYDFIILDGAPVLGVPDSLLFGQHCDGAILSVLRDHTSVPSIYKASETLRSVGIRMIGSVVNGIRCKNDSRVTHLQQLTPKSDQRQLETAEV